jgi:cytochrome c553
MSSKSNNNERNLIALCTSCHNKIGNSNRDEYLFLYMENIESRYGGNFTIV